MPLQWYQIVLWVVVVLAIAYIAGFIFVFSRMVDFRVKMRKELIAASILFSEKKEVLLNFYSLFLDRGVVMNDNDGDMLTLLRWKSMDVRRGHIAQEVHDMLSDVNKRLSYIAMREKLNDDEKVISYFETLDDIDVSYRRIVAVYNNDLTAYEYWRQRKIYTWAYWLIFFRKEARLN